MQLPHRLWSRRQALQRAGALVAAPLALAQDTELRFAGTPCKALLTPVSSRTIRVSVVPLRDGRSQEIPDDGSLVQSDWGEPKSGLVAKVSRDPLAIEVATRSGELVQRLRLDPATGAMHFRLGDGLLLGLGEGGPQFDRRGSIDRMRSGQGGYRLRTHGGRVPVPWIIGAEGWAMFVHQPFGTFDFTGAEGRFDPGGAASLLPLDVFIVAAKEPSAIMAEYARLTGLPEMPPLWAFGYQQSHRTLASREEILAEAKTFREKRLPCDTLIYLGTGFCPSGWNIINGSFEFNRSVFPDPEKMIETLHADHFRVVFHIVIKERALRGSARDRCDPSRASEQEVGCYWDMHRKLFATGVDGWWPDEGDLLNIASRLTRNRMYWEGPQIDRPNERPFALHRNGYAGMQRYASFLWSGDVYSTWETLKTHVPVAINTTLSGIPYWGTDIGGFVPTKEFTGELYVRWFQFGAFNPLFRAHGRTWKLRLPWGWNTGELGPNEISSYGEAANPDPSELHNAAVEPICRKYLELRYRLMPYLYSAVRECCQTGMPIIRGLWLHYPDDPAAVARGDEYLWGRDMLVAPVVEKGATSRRLYLPRGAWYDFWTNERLEGGREIVRAVDLETTPLYVRAGAVIPMDPVRQYTGEKVAGPLTLTVYPGADSSFLLYEDDGATFRYRNGEWMGVHIRWEDRARRLSLRLAAGSRMLARSPRKIEVRVAGSGSARTVSFLGKPLEVRL